MKVILTDKSRPQIIWFNPATENKTKEEGSSVNLSEISADSRETIDVKKIASDDEEMEEEERSWRRGYDAE